MRIMNVYDIFYIILYLILISSAEVFIEARNLDILRKASTAELIITLILLTLSGLILILTFFTFAINTIFLIYISTKIKYLILFASIVEISLITSYHKVYNLKYKLISDVICATHLFLIFNLSRELGYFNYV